MLKLLLAAVLSGHALVHQGIPNRRDKPILAESPVRVLFIGNSHTGTHDIPGTIKQMMQTDGSGRSVYTEKIFVAFLEDAGASPTIRDRVINGNWDIIVCQAVKLSSSHQFSYDHSGAIKIARLAVESGARTYLFSEWPRRGWDETNYILGVYKEVSDASGAPIIPVGRAWDLALAGFPALDLWQPDGNHSSPIGAYLASCVIYYWINGSVRDPGYVPESLPLKQAALMREIALETWLTYGTAGSTVYPKASVKQSVD